MPEEIHCSHIGGDNRLHAVLHNLHSNHVAFGEKGVTHSKRCTASEIERHQHRGVALLNRLEEEVAGVKLTVGRVEDKRVAVVVAFKHHDIAALIGLVVLELSTRYDAALVGEVERDVFIFKTHGRAVALKVTCKSLVLCKLTGCRLEQLHSL